MAKDLSNTQHRRNEAGPIAITPPPDREREFTKAENRMKKKEEQIGQTSAGAEFIRRIRSL